MKRRLLVLTIALNSPYFSHAFDSSSEDGDDFYTLWLGNSDEESPEGERADLQARIPSQGMAFEVHNAAKWPVKQGLHWISLGDAIKNRLQVLGISEPLSIFESVCWLFQRVKEMPGVEDAEKDAWRAVLEKGYGDPDNRLFSQNIPDLVETLEILDLSEAQQEQWKDMMTPIN